ncbi:hypothetical protein EMIHUDRAFT_227199 [Emiliania huxleyi CCMP1516]|uniref:Uncharacterized protein n=2 Tax=Emiliania huxleyi TaxID=2903 RepID=A0A0D3KJE0_EMIH1|nr:hypothetical protein EMIHUDRAFT_227199 [Emiliania huxleyi CCMP1516]EOD35875.1 hypothetical protein EMIHUDRAFT_227199 [Emiliania huxleyi CCMP1516]|eukprot:XP_005788304.1 hypothetical protein EMIHUDRAFT_227199 [Emiliania huxleyi CCMP1516]
MHKRKSRGTLLASAGLAGEPARSPPGGSAAPAAPASAASPAKRPRPLPMLAEPTARGVPLAGGGGGRMAKNFINDARHPFIIVQDKSGRYKPLFHEFRPKDGFSTVPMLMHGHPDDTPGGHLIMSEYDVHVRKQKEKRKAARAACGDDELPRREQRPERPERGGRQGGGGGASSSQAGQGSGVGERERRQRKAPSRWAADPLSVLNLGGRLSELEQARARGATAPPPPASESSPAASRFPALAPTPLGAAAAGSAASAGHSVASLGQALLDREAQEEAAKEAAAQAAHDEAAKEEAPPSAPAPVQSGVGERERRQRKAPSRWAADPLSVLNLGGRLSELEQARANV